MENLIKTLFNIDSNRIESLNSVQTKNGIIVDIKLKRLEEEYCPCCNTKLVGNGYVKKAVNHKALTDRSMKVIVHLQRLRCKSCNYSKTEKNPLVFNGFSNSILTVNQVMMDLHDPRYNYTMIAQRNDVRVNDVIAYFDSYVVIPHIALPENLGIDEIHSEMAKRKDAAYLGVLTDNDSFKLIDILPSRSKWELNNYLASFSKEEREKVKYVTIDMWLPYLEMAHKWLPYATVAVDPFHVIEHLTSDFTKIRVRIMNKCIYGSHSYYLLKSWHKLLESDKYNLDGPGKYNPVFKQKLNYGDLLKMTLEIDDELSLAYTLKESYRYFNTHSTYERAGAQLDDLIASFQSANIKEYEEFIGLLKNWKQEIINSFIISDKTGNRLSNAKSEAMNELIKTHIRVSKGLGNFNRFRKRMLYCFNDRLFVILTEKLTSMKREFKNKQKKEEVTK